MSNCQYCGKETSNPKFCSRTYAAIYNNQKYPKRRGQPRVCKHCGVSIDHLGKRRTVCLSCHPQNVDWSTITIETLVGKRRYQKHSRLRNLARQSYLTSGKLLCCSICGYDTHFEVCYIKAMNDFPLDTLVSTVNAAENLIALCPNHYWEFNNELLKIPP